MTSSTISSRFVDYFVVVGYDFDKQRGSSSTGKVLQRFPETDWPDCPYIEGVELFCQPQGWRISTSQPTPTFYTAVLTDINAQRHYCSCLSFYEEASTSHPSLRHTDDEDMDSLDDAYDLPPYVDFSTMPCSSPNANLSSTTIIPFGTPTVLISSSTSQCTMYVPKCLAIISRHFYLETFRECLGVILSCLVDQSHQSIELEKLIGNLLGSVRIPRPSPSFSRRHRRSKHFSFSLGVGDRHRVKPFHCATLPVTGTSIHTLIQELGIHSLVTLFSAVMTEHKILFHSRSYTRLHDACHALTSLMYPFKYSHVYIPILPSSLFEVLSTPTPFVIGVHSSRKNEVSDILDVIIVDLDGGSVAVPDCVHIPRMDEGTMSELTNLLCAVVRPQLFHADDAFPSSRQGHQILQPSPPHILDKEIRGIFIRLFAILLSGYRTCLQTVRIHPKPFITFHKALFLGQRNLVDNEFAVRLLDSMFFNSFVQERGLPYRECDLFDDYYSTIQENLVVEGKNPDSILTHVRQIAQQLLENEMVIDVEDIEDDDDSLEDDRPVMTSLIQGNASLGSKVFPTLDSGKINEIIESERIKREIERETPSPDEEREKLQFVPMGPTLVPDMNNFFLSSTSLTSSSTVITNSARRLEVMKNCIKCIFENKITDAKKTFPAVLRALKNTSARLALAQELSQYVAGAKAQLGHEQFELVVKLMNCALQQECDSLGGTACGLSGYEDVNGVAAAMLPLAMAFCRKLCTHVIQFAYTCLQDHTIWNNISFWEAAFYHDVGRDITSLYSTNPNAIEKTTDPEKHLEIVAKQLQLIYESRLSESQLEEHAQNEEKTLFSQAVHFSNRIVSLKIPIDVGNSVSDQKWLQPASKSVPGHDGHSDSNSTAWGKEESWRGDEPPPLNHPEVSGGAIRPLGGPNVDNESGFEEDNSGSNGLAGKVNCEIGTNAIKFTLRFVDKVCSEGELPESDVRNLHQMVPVVVAMQIETLDSVYKESKKLPPVPKPKITHPHLLPGEELVIPGLRVFLIPDGRDENYALPSSRTSGGGNNSSGPLAIGPLLLPAEGAIFLTNYRVIFRGQPVDPFYSECPVVRSFPIATLTKEKRITVPSNYLISSIDHYLHEGIQLRSSTFQLIKIAFDEEVSSDSIEAFKKLVNKARSPSDIFSLFTFTSQGSLATQTFLTHQKGKDKSNTFKNVGKKTLRRAAQLTGIPYKSSSKKGHKYLVQKIQFQSHDAASGHHVPGRRLSPSDSIDDKSLDNVSIGSEATTSRPHSATHSSVGHLGAMTLPPIPGSSSNTASSSQLSQAPLLPGSLKERDSREIAKLTELLYVRDFVRLGLGSPKDVAQSPISGPSSRTSIAKLSSPPIPQDPFRISTLNANYTVVSSYPCFLVVPRIVSDDCVKKLSRGYRQGRFPVVTWIHQRKKGLLLRGASFHGKGVIGMFRTHGSTNVATSGTSSGLPSVSESSYAIEQEKYFRAIITLTPSHFIRSQGPRTSFSLAVSNPLPPPSISHGSHGEPPSRPPPPSVIPPGLTATDNIVQPSTSATLSSPSKKNAFSKAMNTLRTSGGKGAIGTIGSSMGRQLQKLDQKFISRSHHEKSSSHQSPSKSILQSSTSSHHGNTSPSSPKSGNPAKTSLYIIGEKGQIKGVKSENYPNCEFVPVDVHEVKHVKASFRKLMRACCPSSHSNDPDLSFFKQVRGSEWYQQIQTILQVSLIIVDLLDVQGSSVMICLEEGWDLVPQLSALAQICLDPFYRTFHGFRTLIEKEWLAFGHRFSHRSNHTASTLTSGFAPVFLQFLDAVHQIMTQFPLSFEFNGHFLKFLAYHYVSCRFRTFLLDCEAERAELGWLSEDIKKPSEQDLLEEMDEEDTLSSMSVSDHSRQHKSHHQQQQFNYTGTSFWSMAESCWSKSPIFYNFLYEPSSNQEEEIKVLRPHSSLSLLSVWDYYTEETVAHGFCYDPEIVKMEKQRKEELEATSAADKVGGPPGERKKRRVCNALYDSTPHEQPSSIALLLEQVRKLESVLVSGGNASWLTSWNKLEIPLMSQTSLSRRAITESYESLARHGLATGYHHQRGFMASFSTSTSNSTIRGTMGRVILTSTDAGSNQFIYSHRPHHFERYAYSKPTNCDYCRNIMWGFGLKTGMKCSECNFNCHDKCSDHVPKNCPGYRAAGGGLKPHQTLVRREVNPPSSLSITGNNQQSTMKVEPDNRIAESDSTDLRNKTLTNSESVFINYESSNVDNITYQGYLNKKGALLKNWKQRWFVLDSIKHQLRYYDIDEQDCKGHIDLADVTGVTHTGGTNFEMTTKKRVYHFSALDNKQSLEWVEKIQACIQ